MTKIFISYRRDDSQWPADRLCKKLQGFVSPDNIFIDVDNIPFGVDFATHIESQVALCDILLALIGNKWDDGRLADPKDFVRVEISAALKRGIRVVPVLIDGAQFPSADALPDALKTLPQRNGVEVRRLSFDADTDRLLRGLGLKKRTFRTVLMAATVGLAVVLAAAIFLANDAFRTLASNSGASAPVITTTANTGVESDLAGISQNVAGAVRSARQAAERASATSAQARELASRAEAAASEAERLGLSPDNPMSAYRNADGAGYAGQRSYALGVWSWESPSPEAGHTFAGYWHSPVGVERFSEADARLKYEGEYSEGQREGGGILSWRDGRRYSGQFQRGTPNGFGIYDYPDGARFEGSVLNEALNGPGIMWDAQHRSREVGIWTNGQLTTLFNDPVTRSSH